MLVVTMIANYLSTQLPAEMRVNDANHTLAVENQVSRLAAAAELLADTGAVGGVVTQPVSLGSAAEPPFAGSDGSTIGPGAAGSSLAVTFVVSGGSAYAPPTVGPAGGTTHGDSCTTSTVELICSGSSKVVWNFTSASATSFTITTSGGPYYINASASGSTFGLTASSTAPIYFLVSGSNDTVDVTVSGTNCRVYLVLLGSYDAVDFEAGSWSGSDVSILMVGNHDSVSTGAQSLSSSHILATGYGTNDSVAIGTTSATGGSSVNTFFNGFNPNNPSAACPVGNLAASTDSVSVSGAQSGGTYNVTWNDTTTSSGTAPPSPWHGTYATPASFACPYYTTVTFPQKSAGTGGASIAVHVRSTYTPQANVVFDQGAVVYAQTNAVPLVLVGPGVKVLGGELTLWVPVFENSVATELGSGTAQVSVRLVGLVTDTLPSTGFSLESGSGLYVNVTTAYPAAWTNYLYSYLNGTVLKGDYTLTCTGCSVPFTFGGPTGKVVLRFPAADLGLLRVQFATYALSVT